MPTQQFLVLGYLRQKIRKRCLDRRLYVVSRSLRRHLSRGQAQVQRRTGAAAVLLLHKGVQMNQIGLEDLQPPPEFLNLIVEFAFYFGSLSCLVTDVNVHVCLGVGRRSQKKVRRPSVNGNFTPATKRQLHFSSQPYKIFGW